MVKVLKGSPELVIRCLNCKAELQYSLADVSPTNVQHLHAGSHQMYHINCPSCKKRVLVQEPV